MHALSCPADDHLQVNVPGIRRQSRVHGYLYGKAQPSTQTKLVSLQSEPIIVEIGSLRYPFLHAG